MLSFSVKAETYPELIKKVTVGLHAMCSQTTAATGELDANPSDPQSDAEPELSVSSTEPKAPKRRGRPRKSAQGVAQAAPEPVAAVSGGELETDGDSEDEAPISERKAAGKAAGKQKQEPAPVAEPSEVEEEITADEDSDLNGATPPAAAKGPTKEEVLAVFNAVHKTRGVPACRTLLVSHGITRMSELKPEKYGAFKAACEKRLAKEA